MYSQFFTGKTVLVTGASGYLATAICRLLQDFECTIVRASRSGNLPVVGGKATLRDTVAEPGSKTFWSGVLPGVDIVFHLAAQTSTALASADAEADLRANVVPMIRLIEEARQRGALLTVVYAGTSTQVGIPAVQPVDELQPDRPVTVYDVHKLAAEQHLLSACADSPWLSGVSLRLTNVYGPGPESGSLDRGVLNRMILRAIRGECLTVFGEGEQVRDYVFIEDVARAFLSAAVFARELRGQYFVLGSGCGSTIAGAVQLVAERVRRCAQKAVDVVKVPAPTGSSPIERRHFTADNSAFRRATRWVPLVALTEGVDRTISYYRSRSVETGAGTKAVSTGEAHPVRLNLGCASRPLPGYVNVDMDSLDGIRKRYPNVSIPAGVRIVQMNIFNLPYPDGEVDEIRADAMLEHLSFKEEGIFFTEVRRVLRPGGTFRFSVPDFEAAVRTWLDASDDWQDFYRDDEDAIRSKHWFGTHSYSMDNRWGYLMACLFGPQNGAGQFHKNAYTEKKIRAILQRLGFHDIVLERYRWKGDRDEMLEVWAVRDQAPNVDG